MRILAVDDKATPRKVLADVITEAAPEAEVVACASAGEALALPDVAAFDVTFLDIDMPGMNGIELARLLKALNPRVNVVFATGYGEYMEQYSWAEPTKAALLAGMPDGAKPAR